MADKTRTEERIKQLSKANYEKVRGIRRHIHRHPELSFKEEGTASYIAQQLGQIGLPYRKGIAGNGLLAILDTGKPGRCIALRADMDALPITENTGLDYASENPGVMHACGHDMHTASLLGTAMVLTELKEELPGGKVYFIFQPAEEKLPGGAKLMLEEGLFGQDKPDAVIAQHVAPEIEAGSLGFRQGMYMASSDEIYLTVKGIGGHGAMPHLLNDPVLMASHIIVALQQVVSRHGQADIPTVLSFGRVQAEGATNVIPEKVEIQGTFRTMNEEWRARAHDIIRSIAEHTAKGMGGECEVDIRKGYPFLQNNPALARNARQACAGFLGADKTIGLDLRMTAEDFAYFTQQFPAMLYRLGVKHPDDNKPAGLHNPAFKPDETALQTGTAYMAWLAIELLSAQA